MTRKLDLGMMIGPRGQTLLAIQDLTRLAAQRNEHATRLRIDIGGYERARRYSAVLTVTDASCLRNRCWDSPP